MPKNPVIGFTFAGYDFMLVDYHYYPGYSGSYENPPEPPELEISKLWMKWSDDVSKEAYTSVPDPVIDLLLEVVDAFSEAAMEAIEDHIAKEEREYEPRYPDSLD